MNNEKRDLISNLLKKLGLDDPDLQKLIEVLVAEDNVLNSFKEAVCDTVNEYHNQKKELLVIIEELVIVLSATRDYECDKEAYSEKQEELLHDTGTDVLVKAFRVLKK